jgi:protein O-mannosyl-transferase
MVRNMIERPLPSPRGATIIAVTSLLLVAGTVYVSALSHEILDLDYSCWVQAVQPVNAGTLWRVITCDQSVWHGLGYFAPLTAVSFMGDLWFGSLIGSPELMHKLVNVALHLLNSLLVMWLIRALGFELWVAFGAALIFAVHPLQVSSVAWIAERKNLLTCTFFLSGLLCYCRYRRDGKYSSYGAVLVAYVLALLAKPSAVALGPCLFITDWFLIDRRLSGRSAARVAPLLVIGLLWVLVAARTELPVANIPPLLDRILLAPYNVGFLVWKFFVPTDLSLLYPVVNVDAASTFWWIPVVVFALTIGLIAGLHRRRPVWSLLWASAFYVVNVIPSAGIIPFSGMKDLHVADHYQYVASIGLCLLVSLAMDSAFKSRHTKEAVALRVVCVAVLATVLSLRCADQLHTWQNPQSLWKHVISLNPSCYQAHFNYGTYLDEKQRYPEAVTHYGLALDVGPQRPDAYKLYYNLGMIMVKYGSMTTAADYFERSLEARPEFMLPHVTLAEIYFESGQYKQALDHCRSARKYGADCRPEDLERVIWQETRNVENARNYQ